MKTLVSALAVAVAATLPLAGMAQDKPKHQFVTAKALKWGESPALPGAKVAVIEGPLNEAAPFTMRIQLPANYKIAAHSHSAIEHVTVISGEFGIAIGEKFDQKKLTKLGPGAVAIMQPKTPHYVLTTKPTEIQVHGVGPWTLAFVNPKDDPRKQ